MVIKELAFCMALTTTFVPANHAPMSADQPGDGVYVITCRHGLCTEIAGTWRNYGFKEGDDIWLVKPTNDPDLAILR